MDMENYMRFIAALIFVLALIGVAAWLARRFGFGTRSGPVRGGQRRLQVVEIATIDAKRRAILFRRDDTEHLIVTGGITDLVIETGIPAPLDTAPETQPATLPKPKPTTRTTNQR